MWRQRKRLILLAAAVVAVSGVAILLYVRSGESSLVSQLGSGTPAERVKAAQELGKINSARAVEAIAGAVRDRDTQVACQAVVALGRMARPESLPHIQAAAKDSREEVREAAATAMGKLGDHADVPTLLAAAGDRKESERVRAAASQSLGFLEVFEAMPVLVDSLDDPSPLVRGRAYAAIRRILQRDFGFRAEDPPEKRQPIVARIRMEYPAWANRHAEYKARMKGKTK